MKWIAPTDEANLSLARQTSSSGGVPPFPDKIWDLVVLGGGSAGLVAAIGAAGLGASVLLLEKDKLGGDCLHGGCVPSKSILEAAHRAHLSQGSAEKPSFEAVFAAMRRIRAELAHHDSKDRLLANGVFVGFGKARFLGPNQLSIQERRISFKRALIATGSRPVLPAISGLAPQDLVTTQHIFDLQLPPSHLTILGGGPVGCELAQAFQRLGVPTRIIQKSDRLLPRDDPQASRLLAEKLKEEGIEIHLGGEVELAEKDGAGWVLQLRGKSDRLRTGLLLAAIGREPDLEDLGLDEAGIRLQGKRLWTDRFLATTNPRVYAAGDVTGLWQFTHASDAMARLVLRNGLLGFPMSRKSVQSLVIPWITWTWPRVGGVGLDEPSALAQGAKVYFTEAAQIDRLRLAGKSQGFFKLFATPRGKILGARACGEEIEGWLGLVTQAMEQNLTLSQLADGVHPYPSHHEALKRMAGEFRRQGFSPFMKGVIQTWLRWRS